MGLGLKEKSEKLKALAKDQMKRGHSSSLACKLGRNVRQSEGRMSERVTEGGLDVSPARWVRKDIFIWRQDAGPKRSVGLFRRVSRLIYSITARLTHLWVGLSEPGGLKKVQEFPVWHSGNEHNS